MFDVVVVGGGAAGCVVAARLSESASRSVLLLEAGPDLRANPPDEIRDGWQITRQFDWGYKSEPDSRGAVRNVWRNKLLGGTSWVTRFTPRGSPADFDEWAALGNEGWGFEEVLPYFKRLETDVDFGDKPWHGNSGPMPSNRYLNVEYTEIGAAALRALEASGFPLIEDHNRPGAVGAGRMSMSSRDGVRVTTADAYLPAGKTPLNLTIRADAHVADVLFEGGLARGVRLLDGTVIEASWVVLCAGTYGSAPLLMRSGIGPADHLRSVGVPVRVDLPGVGANLTDHPALSIDCGYRGPVRDAPILHLIATFRSAGRSSDEAPDLMFWLSDPEAAPGGPSVFEIGVVLMRPRSRGTVRLRSADPADAPRIELPSLTDPLDVERVAEGYRRGLEVARRPEIRRLCDDPSSPEAGGGELLELIRANAVSIPHVVGTCSMGSRPDQGAVVDAWGRVHGTERLSVVDASIMPDVPSGFTHFPTIMIAERLSERLASLIR
ncbi:MAG: GMC family oxidoreductase N-terminal domain-containing protein [Candidatus Dormibacteraeota bacterium]|nr:GMC family oxidoreductase N-terminal domain-containing protein [Candidatus Dormibacteraeota bacterium]